MKALKDLWYMVGVWMILRLNPISGAELLEKWAKVLRERPLYKLKR